MRGEDELLEVIASLYDAASEIVPWSPALCRVARCLDSRAATLFSFDSREKRIVWLETSDPALGGVTRGNAALQTAYLDEPTQADAAPLAARSPIPRAPSGRFKLSLPLILAVVARSGSRSGTV